MAWINGEGGKDRERNRKRERKWEREKASKRERKRQRQIDGSKDDGYRAEAEDLYGQQRRPIRPTN